ncbi:MAG: hypothetical protein IH591_06030 [Bacteroidales bacterium]|nr:hypothetical protein [Bacteroidales bacterium]
MRKHIGNIVPALALFIVISATASAQSEKPPAVTLTGYVKYMNTAIFDEFDSFWTLDNLIHNRLNFKWYMGSALTLTAEARNRVIYGDYVRLMPGYAEMISRDNGFLHFLTGNIVESRSMILATSVDRLNIEYQRGSFSATIGRQRINWGQSFAWNPNDIFNAYSFFDFDYEERPGSDAVRIQYFPGFTSVAEAAIKLDKDNNITAAMLYRFNKWGYDLQLMGGVIDSSDYVAGAGWSGSLGKVGFTGEASYFHPQQNFSDTTGVLLATAGINYIFSNSLSVSAEVIYNGYFSRAAIDSFNDLYFMPMTVKTISFSKFSWFAQMAYPIHPLLNGSLAAMYFPSLGDGYFIMPSLSWSVAPDAEVSLTGQHFSGSFSGGERERLNLLFLRFRYDF